MNGTDAVMKKSLTFLSAGTLFMLLPAYGCESAHSVKNNDLGEGGTEGHFELWQLPSQTNSIGNSYILVTENGCVIVMDGGMASDAEFLRGHINALGGVVDIWFISHPHDDHVSAFNSIAGDQGGITIKKLYYSRLPDAWTVNEPITQLFYTRLAVLSTQQTQIINLSIPGSEITIDGVYFKILGVANPEITNNSYNNSSMVIRAWDREKSVVFLADAGIEAGNKVLSKYKTYLDCDYLQVAHHGQQGCSENFYKTISFKACLWPTPEWLWNARPGNPQGYTTWETRRWMDEIGIPLHYVAWRDGMVKISDPPD